MSSTASELGTRRLVRTPIAPIRKVVIAGSRTVWPSVEEIDAAILKLDGYGILWVPEEWTHVVCGMAKGGDMAGKVWAEARGKEVLQRPITPRMVSQWGKWAAPKMRNREMAEVGDAAICFWDGLSSGTPDMAARMLARGKPCEVIPWPRKKRGG